MVGAIAGPLLALLLFGLVTMALLRWRKRRAATKYIKANQDGKDSDVFDKAQLHADSISPRYELDTLIEIHELAGSMVKGTASELPALEPVGSEMPIPEAKQADGEDLHEASNTMTSSPQRRSAELV